MIHLFVFSDAIGRIRVLSVKTALSTLCAGRLVDKLRCKLLFLTKLHVAYVRCVCSEKSSDVCEIQVT